MKFESQSDVRKFLTPKYSSQKLLKLQNLEIDPISPLSDTPASTKRIKIIRLQKKNTNDEAPQPENFELPNINNDRDINSFELKDKRTVKSKLSNVVF